MDLSKVKQIITPRGSLEKILKSGVVIWSKKTANKYKILKNDELVAEVTMTEFVKAIQSGAAQEDWGIGAQIVIPYTDPYNKITYDCPFNFGTFNWYPGKLGLQTHYALPSTPLTYSSSNWLTGTFPNCLPKDFVDVLQTISFKGSSPRVFLLTATQSYANPVYKYVNNSNTSLSSYYRSLSGSSKQEYSAWEYWRQKIGTLQVYSSIPNSTKVSSITPPSNSNRIVYLITNKNARANTRTSTGVTITQMVNLVQKSPVYYLSGFSTSGAMTNVKSTDTTYFQPACVIG